MASPKISIQPVPSSVWLGHDFRAAQAADEADREQAAQVVVKRRQHVQEIGENRFFLDWRPAVGATDAGEHGRNMPIRLSSGAPSWW
jgi:hypothetical protein